MLVQQLARRRAIIVLRQRIPAAALSTGPAQLAVTGLFRPRRARPRTVAAPPSRPESYPSRGETAQTAWRLRSGWLRTPPLPAGADGVRDRHRRRSSLPNQSARAPD